jgi:hypothetical protein
VVSEKKRFETFFPALYKLKVFCSGMKFKMAATAGFSLTLDLVLKIKP